MRLHRPSEIQGRWVLDHRVMTPSRPESTADDRPTERTAGLECTSGHPRTPREAANRKEFTSELARHGSRSGRNARDTAVVYRNLRPDRSTFRSAARSAGIRSMTLYSVVSLSCFRTGTELFPCGHRLASGRASSAVARPWALPAPVSTRPKPPPSPGPTPILPLNLEPATPPSVTMTGAGPPASPNPKPPNPDTRQAP